MGTTGVSFGKGKAEVDFGTAFAVEEDGEEDAHVEDLSAATGVLALASTSVLFTAVEFPGAGQLTSPFTIFQ